MYKTVSIGVLSSNFDLCKYLSAGGQAKTMMFVHINPEVNALGETISTLKFAERVASIDLGAARSNKEAGEIRELRDEVIFLSLLPEFLFLVCFVITRTLKLNLYFFRYQTLNWHWRKRRLS